MGAAFGVTGGFASGSGSMTLSSGIGVNRGGVRSHARCVLISAALVRVQNMSALDMAHAADRKWPLESARHALVSRRSAASAKAEVCGCVLHDAIRLPVAPGAGAGTCDRVSVDSPDAAPHRTSASDNHKRYVGLALRWRRTAARGCLVACNRCAGTCGR
eukprot:3216884-Pleurochrysis_carterae.AAC.1